MHFLRIIELFLIIFYQKIFASIYNNTCATTCNFPGLICVSGQCKCDTRYRLFWTGSRCLHCPDNWAMSEIACISYNGTDTTRVKALATCESMQGDLISIHDNSIIPLIYHVTGNNKRRRKQVQIVRDKLIGWTSGYAVYITNLGLYRWHDNRSNDFDSRSSWWCTRGTPNLGYTHTHNEPSRFSSSNGDAENCILYRRGNTSIQVVCLDDVFCNEEFPFICERTESTAEKFFGSSPMNMGLTTTTTSTESTVNVNSTTDDEHLLGMLTSSNDKLRQTIIISTVIGLLLLASVIFGIFFMKHRRAKKTNLHSGDNDFKEIQSTNSERPSITSSVNGSVLDNEDNVSIGSNISPGIIDDSTQQKNKRGGYTRQNFDEFE